MDQWPKILNRNIVPCVVFEDESVRSQISVMLFFKTHFICEWRDNYDRNGEVPHNAKFDFYLWILGFNQITPIPCPTSIVRPSSDCSSADDGRSTACKVLI